MAITSILEVSLYFAFKNGLKIIQFQLHYMLALMWWYIVPPDNEHYVALQEAAQDYQFTVSASLTVATRSTWISQKFHGEVSISGNVCPKYCSLVFK